MSTPKHNSTWKSVAVNTAQTGAAVWTPASGKRVAVTHVQIGTQGSTVGKLTLWFGAAGDTAYTEGTDQPVVKQTFSPNAAANLNPGLVVAPLQPIFGGIDQPLKITTSANLDCDVVVYGYECS